jgi:uncharacterized protein (DUF433 family)
MVTPNTNRSSEPWRKRLYLPSYQVGEAARYAGVSPRTVADWHLAGERQTAPLSRRDSRTALSYLQLIEVAVVAAFRKEGVTLKRIRQARAYVAKELGSEFPFCEYRFKTDGKRLWIDYEEIEGEKGKDKLLGADQVGQLAWSRIIGRLKQFEYEDGGFAIRWRVAGASSPVIIDPRLSFGAPTVNGTPTWVIRGRWVAGESPSEIASDFALRTLDVREALKFEGIVPDPKRKKQWIH